MTFKKRIIIGGLPRAGTTLFRYLLDASSQIVCAPETGFFLSPWAYRTKRLDLTVPRLDRVLLLGEEKITEIVSTSEDAFDCYDRLMLAYVKAKNLGEKTVWAEKTPRNAEFYPRLIKEQRDLYIISVIRDGRDILTSIFPGRDEYYVPFERYALTVNSIFDFQHPQHLIVRYEDLVARPEPTMKGVFDYLDLPFERSILETYKAYSPSRDPSLVNQPKVTKPISQSWVGRWSDDEHAERMADFLNNDEAMAVFHRSGYSLN